MYIETLTAPPTLDHLIEYLKYLQNELDYQQSTVQVCTVALEELSNCDAIAALTVLKRLSQEQYTLVESINDSRYNLSQHTKGGEK